MAGKKRKKNWLWIPLIIIAVLAILAICLFIFWSSGKIKPIYPVPESQNRPSSFSVKLSGDLTSSGATRTYNGFARYENGRLTEGYAELEIDDGNNKQVIACDFSGNSWVSSTGACTISIPPADSSQFWKMVSRGKYARAGTEACAHGTICYEIESYQ